MDDESRGTKLGQRQDVSVLIVEGSTVGAHAQESLQKCFCIEALESWRDYQLSGNHSSGDQVSRWLKTWGSDEHSELPGCNDSQPAP